ncbi:MAG: flagellar hook-associated family protein [Pseudomonadota bacterium]
MEASFISTAALRNQPRLEVNRLQNELADRTVELATGRHADVGLALGTETGRMISLRNEAALMETLIRSNGTAQARLTLIQAGLTDIRDNASDLLASAVAIPPGEGAARVLETEARAAMDRLSDRLNASDGGSFLFAGINTDEAPFTRLEDGPEAAIIAAFNTRFGLNPGDPGVDAILPADMTDFLRNEFAAFFDDPAWGTTFSVASSDNIVTRIAISERAPTGTNANEQGIRNTAEAMTMLAVLGLDTLSEGTRQAVIDEARLGLGQAVSDLAGIQSELGFSQNAIERANERMSLARDMLAGIIAEAEVVDPAEAKVRVDLLTTQIEMSFALTGQISRLSILNYA